MYNVINPFYPILIVFRIVFKLQKALAAYVMKHLIHLGWCACMFLCCDLSGFPPEGKHDLCEQPFHTHCSVLIYVQNMSLLKGLCASYFALPCTSVILINLLIFCFLFGLFVILCIIFLFICSFGQGIYLSLSLQF